MHCSGGRSAAAMKTTEEALCFMMKLQGQNLDQSKGNQKKITPADFSRRGLSGHQYLKTKMGRLIGKMKMTERMRKWARRVTI